MTHRKTPTPDSIGAKDERLGLAPEGFRFATGCCRKLAPRSSRQMRCLKQCIWAAANTYPPKANVINHTGTKLRASTGGLCCNPWLAWKYLVPLRCSFLTFDMTIMTQQNTWNTYKAVLVRNTPARMSQDGTSRFCAGSCFLLSVGPRLMLPPTNSLRLGRGFAWDGCC